MALSELQRQRYVARIAVLRATLAQLREMIAARHAAKAAEAQTPAQGLASAQALMGQSRIEQSTKEATPIPPNLEPAFQQWIKANKITDLDNPDSHYDYRGLFMVGGRRSPDGHFPDTFKQHGHPTFSVESQYSTGPNDGGRWQGDQFVPPAPAMMAAQPQSTPSIPESIMGRVVGQGPLGARTERVNPADLGLEPKPGEPVKNALKFVPSMAIGIAEDGRKFITGTFQDKADVLNSLSGMLPWFRTKDGMVALQDVAKQSGNLDLRASLGEVLGPLYDLGAAVSGDQQATDRLEQSGGLAPAASLFMLLGPKYAKSAGEISAREATTAEAMPRLREAAAIDEFKADVAGIERAQTPKAVEHTMPDGTKMPGPEHPGAVPGTTQSTGLSPEAQAIRYRLQAQTAAASGKQGSASGAALRNKLREKLAAVPPERSLGVAEETKAVPQEARNAEGLRGNEGQVYPRGDERVGGAVESGANLEQPAPDQPRGAAQRPQEIASTQKVTPDEALVKYLKKSYQRYNDIVKNAPRKESPKPIAEIRQIAQRPQEAPQAEAVTGPVEMHAGVTPRETETVRPIEEMGGGIGMASPGMSLGAKLGREIRRAKAQQGAPEPPSITLGDVVVEVEKSQKQPGVMQYVTTPSNYVGAIPGQRARFGPAATEAVRKTVLGEIDLKREFGRRQEISDRVIKGIDKKDFGKAGEKFIDAFEGKPIEEIKSDPSLGEGTKSSAEELRSYLDDDRSRFQAYYRDVNRSWVSKAAEREYRKANGLGRKRLDDRQRAAIADQTEARLKEMVPDSWGIDDYFPHIYPGEFLVKMRNADGRFVTIGSAATKAEAMSVVANAAVSHPELTAKDFQVKSKGFVDPDVVRLSTGRFFGVANKIAKAAEVSQAEVMDAISGKIGMRASRKKFFGNLKRRTGAAGYSKDLEKVLRLYNYGAARFHVLNPLNREVAPIIEGIRKTGNAPLADYVQGVFDQVWGTRQRASSRSFDATLQAIPGLKNMVQPFALERWTARFVKGPVAALKWRFSPRGQALNSMQLTQTTLAVVDVSEFADGIRFHNSAEGRAARLKHGVRFVSGGKLSEAEAPIHKQATGRKIRLNAPETMNQETAWSILYNKAIKDGMPEKAAADYAFLRGNVYTQFAHLKSDVPPALRGPVMSTILMFKRFPIKNLELASDLIRDRNFPGAGKWLGSQLVLGGVRGATRPLLMVAGGYTTLKAYNSIRDKFGKQLADFIAYGLSGLVGMDMSYSIQMLDAPFGDTPQEKIGNVVLGPPGADAVRVWSAWRDTKGTETKAWKRALTAFVKSNPAMRWVEGISQLHEGARDGLYDFRSPNGKLRFRSDLKDVIINALGGKPLGNKVSVNGRTIDMAPMDMWVDAYTEIEAQRSEVIDKAIAQSMANPESTDWNQGVIEWNNRWPEFAITMDDLAARYNRRAENKDLTTQERILNQGPKALRGLNP